jgi:hypothetical protein
MQFARDYDTDLGRELWKTLNNDVVVARMETASDLDQPALKSVEDILLSLFAEQILADRTKQMIGHMTKQVMESRGYEHVTTDVRMNSVPFYKASRYQKAGRDMLYLFQSSKDRNEIALTDERDGGKLPEAPNGAQWRFVNVLTSPIKASIGFGIRLTDAVDEVKKTGFFRHRRPRVLRPA